MELALGVLLKEVMEHKKHHELKKQKTSLPRDRYPAQVSISLGKITLPAYSFKSS